MKKVRNLRFLGILCVGIAVLFLISISVTQAQVKIQGPPPGKGKPPKDPKPPPEPEATWAVRIPTQAEATNNNQVFYGMDSIDDNPYYLHNGDNIEVTVERNRMTGSYGRYHEFVYALRFFLTNKVTDTPPEYYVGYQNVGDFSGLIPPDPDKPSCQFPNVTSLPPDCLADFLNNQHPYSKEGNSVQNYEFFWIRISIFDFDIEGMVPGASHQFLLRGTPQTLDDLFRMQNQYRKGCQRDPAFHNFEIYNHGPYDYSIWITRLYEDTYSDITHEGIWRIEVNGQLHVREMYCAKEKGRSTIYTPLEATGNFNFYVDWIKNPVKE